MPPSKMSDRSKTSTPVAKYDAPSTGIFALLPSSWIPYAELMRLDRPAGYYAFYWHYAIGTGFAASVAYPRPELFEVLRLAIHLACWVVVLRGAVCTLNDNMDQEFDRKVSRTKFRPIARGAVSTSQGHIFTLTLMVIGGLMLYGLPRTVIVYAVLITAILSIYPLGKRVTDFPQVILGLGFALPVFMCCAALDADPMLSPDTRLAGASLCLYFALALWTIIFDTVYAHQDLKDDVLAGVRGLAVLLGDRTKLWLGVLAAIQVGCLVGCGILCRFGAAYFLLSCGGAAVALASMLILVNLKLPSDCAWWFGPGSRLVGAHILAGLVAQYTLRLL